MRKRSTFIVLCLLLFSLVLAGCSNQLSSEAEAYKEEVHEKYNKRARAHITEALEEKYGEDVTITRLEIVANLDYFFGFSTEPYKKVATGKAKIGKDEFDVYLRWEIDNNPANFVCCDNREKEDILRDLDEYFTNLYGQKPYAAYYEVFSSLGYEFKKEDGMLEAKYSGNIEDYLNQFGGLVRIAIAFEDLDIPIMEEFLDNGETVNDLPEALSKARNIYIINTFKNTLTEKDLASIISRGKIKEFLPLINEYVQLEKGVTKKWLNNMTEFAEFTYDGTVVDKNVLIDYTCDFNVNEWDSSVVRKLKDYDVVSNWYYAPDLNSTFYINEDYLDPKSSKYIILFCCKNGENGTKYTYDFVSSNNSGYLMISPKHKNSWFIVYAQKETKFNIIDEIKEFFSNPI